MKYSLVCAVLFLHFIKSEAILCYRCDASTDNKDRADCIHKTRMLSHHRYLYQYSGKPLVELSYLKNCSKYRNQYGDEIFKFCKIEVIQSHGTTNAYLRDCSDGINFASLNVTRLSNPRPDNQTTCGFSQLQGATQCVQLCDEDFCNGPFSSHAPYVSVSIAMIVINVISCWIYHNFVSF